MLCLTSSQETTVGPSQWAKGNPFLRASSRSSCLVGTEAEEWFIGSLGRREQLSKGKRVQAARISWQQSNKGAHRAHESVKARSLFSDSQSCVVAEQPPGGTFSCWDTEAGSLTFSAGDDPSQPEHPACRGPEGPGCPPRCRSAALLGKTPVGQRDVPSVSTMSPGSV